MRVYLPATFGTLRRLVDGHGVGEPPLPAYAVTPAQREWYPGSDEEELEYLALTQAAAASVRLIDADPEVERRRVVVVATVRDGEVKAVPAVHRTAVRVGQVVDWPQLEAVHVDDPAAVADVTAAADAVVAADLGSEEAAFTVDQAQGHELLWYATQEIPALAGGEG